MEFTCPGCKKRLRARGSGPVRCPACSHEIVVARPGKPDGPRCPDCGGHDVERKERTSGAGWAVFCVLLVLFFPLCWVGMLIKEEIDWCHDCRRRIRTR